MDVRQLEYFLAVVDHGGLNRAAAALYVAQPSLSQAIRVLERDLGSDLFLRIGRRLVLTRAGQALIEPAREAVRALELARASVEAVEGLRTGRLEVAAMPSQAVDPLSDMIQRFSDRHPEVTVVVRAASTARDVVEMVRGGTTELGLLASREPPVWSEVVLHEMPRQRFVLVCAPQGPFPAGSEVAWERLAGQRLIVGQPGTGMRQFVDGVLASGVNARVVVESEHRGAILPLVLKGVGAAVLSESWAPLAEKAGAVVVGLVPAAYLHLALASRHGRVTPAAREFLALTVDRPGL